MKDIEEIVKDYSNNIYKYLLCLTHNYDISEELTQETMYRAVKYINQLRNEEKIELWLCKIAKNLWIQELHKQKRYVTIDNDSLKNLEDNSNVENDFIQKYNKLELYKYIERLDDVSKEIISLRLNGDLRFKDIAGMYGKSENWARVIFYRAKQQIIKEVKKDDEKDRV